MYIYVYVRTGSVNGTGTPKRIIKVMKGKNINQVVIKADKGEKVKSEKEHKLNDREEGGGR